MYRLSHTFTLDSAHFLPGYPGKCGHTHGHRWSITVSLSGQKLNQQGMLIDFQDVKQICKDQIISQLDHRLLNHTIQQPTAENLSKWIYNRLKNQLPGLEAVLVCESPGQCISYSLFSSSLINQKEDSTNDPKSN